MGVLAALVLVLSAAVPGQAAEEEWVWAFLHADQPGTHEPYEPENRAGSPGVTVTVDKLPEGSDETQSPSPYRVRLAGGAAPRGVPVVSAVAAAGVHCQVMSFGPAGRDEVVDVACYTGTTLTDSAFTLSFSSSPPASAAAGAYGYTDTTTAASHNSTGEAVTVEYDKEAGPHEWVVRFAGAAFDNSGGNVQLTPVGADPARCAVVLWHGYDFGQDREGVELRVRCDNLANPAVRPQWSLMYAHERSITGGTSGFFGYLQADKPDATAEYPPNPARNVGTADFTHTIVPQTGDGRYRANVFGPLAVPMALHVSANGDSGTFCTLVRWSLTGLGGDQPAGLVDIACYGRTGTATDSMFTLNYYSPGS